MTTPFTLVQSAPRLAFAAALEAAGTAYIAQHGQPPARILIPAGQAEAVNALDTWQGIPLVESRLVARRGEIWHFGFIAGEGTP